MRPLDTQLGRIGTSVDERPRRSEADGVLGEQLGKTTPPMRAQLSSRRLPNPRIPPSLHGHTVVTVTEIWLSQTGR